MTREREDFTIKTAHEAFSEQTDGLKRASHIGDALKEKYE